MIEPWEKLDSQYLGDFRIFRIRQDTSLSPRTGATHRFFVLESPDWVNVIPLTPEGNVIMIRQYRHGMNQRYRRASACGTGSCPCVPHGPQRAKRNSPIQPPAHNPWSAIAS